MAPEAAGYGADVAYSSNDLYSRENRLEDRIRDGGNTGALSRYDAANDLRTLHRIRRYQDERAGESGYLSHDARADVSGRLETLDSTVSAQWRE